MEPNISNYLWKWVTLVLICLFSCKKIAEKQDSPISEANIPRTTNGKNIVFITFDELGATFLGAYGSGVKSSPTMDRLASEGMKFNKCYASSPVCAPNRATFLTGRSPVVHGIIFNNLALASDMPTYPHVLQRHGYRTGVFGKMHQTPMWKKEPENLEFMGFDEGILIEDDKWGEWLKWIEKEHPDQLDNALAFNMGKPSRSIF